MSIAVLVSMLPYPVGDAVCSTDGDQVALLDTMGELYLGPVEGPFRAMGRQRSSNLQLSPRGEVLSLQEEGLATWEFEGGRIDLRPWVGGRPGRDASFQVSPDGSFIAVRPHGGSVLVFDRALVQQLATVPGEADQLVWSSDESMLVSGRLVLAPLEQPWRARDVSNRLDVFDVRRVRGKGLLVLGETPDGQTILEHWSEEGLELIGSRPLSARYRVLLPFEEEGLVLLAGHRPGVVDVLGPDGLVVEGVEVGGDELLLSLRSCGPGRFLVWTNREPRVWSLEELLR